MVIFKFALFELAIALLLHLLIVMEVLLVYRILVGVVTLPPLPQHLSLLCDLCGIHMDKHMHMRKHISNSASCPFN